MSDTLTSLLLFAAAAAICVAMWLRAMEGPRHLYVQAALATGVTFWTGALLLINLLA